MSENRELALEDPKNGFNRISLLALCLLSIALTTPIALLGPFFPSAASRHGQSVLETGWIIACLPLAVFLFAPFCGRILRPLHLIVIGGLITTVSVVTFGFIDSLQGLRYTIASCIIRIVHGIGYALVV